MAHKLDDEGNEIIDLNASNMIEALRDIGYSLESAVADIIVFGSFQDAGKC